MIDGSSSPGTAPRTGHEHWHVGANYPNEPCLGQIGCVSHFNEVVDIMAHDLIVGELSPGDIAGVDDISAYLDQIRSWETRICNANGIAFLADGLVFWAQRLPSDRADCADALLQSPLP